MLFRRISRIPKSYLQRRKNISKGKITLIQGWNSVWHAAQFYAKEHFPMEISKEDKVHLVHRNEKMQVEYTSQTT